jgi:hypothetical protein
MFFRAEVPLQEAQRQMVYAAHVSKMEQKDVERAFTRLFSSDDGQKVLAWLQTMTFNRAQGASSTEEQLRYMEGQRAMVATILRLIDRGRAA